MKSMMKKPIALLLAVCLCCLSGVGCAQTLDDEAAARAFAETFFASPYVDEPLQAHTLAVTQAAYGWQAVLTPDDAALPTLTVWFTADGRVQQFKNSAYALPSIADIDTQMVSLDDARRIDTLRNALFPDMPNNECGLYASADGASYYVLDRFTFWLGLIMEPDLIKLVSYIDLQTDAAGYPGMITRGEAVAAARQTIAETYGLSADTVNRLTVTQADFVLQSGIWTDADVPLPYWFVLLADPADSYQSQYNALIDAETGEILECHDPATAGNG